MRRISDFQFQISNWAAALLLGLTTAAAIAAEDVPTITVSKGDQINLALSPLAGSDGAAATKIVQNDLALSGYFTLGGANSTYTVRGTASSGGVQGRTGPFTAPVPRSRVTDLIGATHGARGS